MADSSTTAIPILNLLPGRDWARCQLPAGIGYVSVVSILMISLYTLGGGPVRAMLHFPSSPPYISQYHVALCMISSLISLPLLFRLRVPRPTLTHCLPPPPGGRYPKKHHPSSSLTSSCYRQSRPPGLTLP